MPTTTPSPTPAAATPDWTELCRAQTERLQVADPLLGVTPPPEEGETPEVLGVGGSSGAIWGILREATVRPDDPLSAWVPLHRQILQIRSAAPPDTTAFAELLTRWLSRLEPSEGLDAGRRAAVVRLPVVERELALPLLDAGFVPQTTTAIRRVAATDAATPTDGAAPAAARAGSGVTLRSPVPEDQAALLELAVEMHASDVHHRSAFARPDMGVIMGHYVEEMLGFPEGWAHVAIDDDGTLLGLVSLDPPEHSTWAAPSTSLAPTVYLGMAAVTVRARQRGVGGALVRAVHGQAARTGQAAILLDHAALSPLSSTFWHRQGYRPLATTWLRPV